MKTVKARSYSVYSLIAMLLFLLPVVTIAQVSKDSPATNTTIKTSKLEITTQNKVITVAKQDTIEQSSHNKTISKKTVVKKHTSNNPAANSALNPGEVFTVVFDKNGKIIDGYPQYVSINDYIAFDLEALAKKAEKAEEVFAKKLKEVEEALKGPSPSCYSERCFSEMRPSMNSFFNQEIIKQGNCYTPFNSAYQDSLQKKYTDIDPFAIIIQLKYNGKALVIKPISFNISAAKQKGNTYKIANILSENGIDITATKNLEIEITIHEYNRLNKVIRSVLDDLEKQKITYYDYDNWLPRTTLESIKEEMDAVYLTLIEYNMLKMVETGCCQLEIAGITNMLDSINARHCKEHAIAEKVICKNIPWLVSTAWIAGKPRLNPLGLKDEGTLSETVEDLTFKNQVMRYKVAGFDSLIRKCKSKNCVSDINTMLFKRDYLQDLVLKNEQTIELKNAQIASNNKKLLALTEEYKILNQMRYFVSHNREIFIMRNHDAANKLELAEQWLPFKQVSYEQAEKVRIVTYNIEEAAKLGYGETTVQIDDEPSLFTEQFLKVTDEVMKQQEKLQAEILKNKGARAMPDGAKTNEDLTNKINCFIKNYSRIIWLSAQTAPITDYKLEERGPVYRTEVQTPNKKNKIPALVQYQLTNTVAGNATKTFTTDSFAYKVYRKLYVQVMAGISCALGGGVKYGRVNTVYNSANGTFSSTALKPYDVVIGIKVFPMGLNIRRWFPSVGPKRYHNMLIRRGDHAVNRISFMAGMGVSQSQLRNYFLGVGYEIVPGLGINTGVNFYGQNHFKLENGTLILQEQRFKPAAFVAITVDPVVMIRASNLFNFKL
ncbi:MAG TPA: hypothetical protein VK174_09920 [Chitinophagales bacterium]|nr:hypothetical protein [Chitinophagales bacterium]